MEHPQAHILRAIADGKQIQLRPRNTKESWADDLLINIINALACGGNLWEFRIKPSTININGHEVPEPKMVTIEGFTFAAPSPVETETHNTQVSTDEVWVRNEDFNAYVECRGTLMARAIKEQQGEQP